MKYYNIKSFILVCLCFISFNCFAIDAWRNVVENNLVKYFNYKWNKDKIYRSGNVFIDTSHGNEINRFDPITFADNNSAISIKLRFNLKSVKNVLLIKAGCKFDSSFISFFKLKPTKNIQYISTRFRTKCFRKAITLFLFVRTQNNKIYGASQLLVSRYKEGLKYPEQIKTVIPGEDLSVALNPLNLEVYQNLKKYLNYNDTEINTLNVISSDFILNHVKEVLILHVNCVRKKIPLLVTYYKGNNEKNISNILHERKANCKEGNERYTYVKTKKNKFYYNLSGYIYYQPHSDTSVSVFDKEAARLESGPKTFNPKDPRILK